MVADMPWPHEADDPRPAERGRATHDYPTMAIDEMCAMPIGRRAAKDCVLYFWTPNFHVESAYKVMRAWGFREFPTIITWAKDAVGRGQRLRSATEQCIVAIKGKPTWHLTNQTTLLCGPVRAESQKPDEFYALIDELTPTAQRSLELFPRRTLPKGWDGYGDQVGKFKRVEGQDEASLLIVLDAIDAGEPIWFSDKLGAWQRFYTGKRKLKLTRPGRQQLAVLREQKEERERKEVDHDRARLHQRGVKLGHDITNTFDPTGALTHEIATCSCGWTCALPLTASAERGKLLPIEEAKDAHLREMIAAAEAGKNVEQRSNKARRARARVGAPAEPQEERKFPDGMAGHVVAMTREYPGDGTPPLSVATCQCGWQSKQPVPDHELQDAAIDAHWQAIADETDAGAQSNLALQAAE
jgi:N6-adenosine-specific RNA methylase IME4